MVARLPQVLVHGSTRSLRLLPQLEARDSSRSLDDNNTASKASILGVLPRSVCRSFRVVRCTQTEGAGAEQPPAQVHLGGQACRLPPTCVTASLP